MMLVPIIGYQASGRTTIFEEILRRVSETTEIHFSPGSARIEAWVGTYKARGRSRPIILLRDAGPAHELLFQIHKYNKLGGDAIIVFEWPPTLEAYKRVDIGLRNARWLLAHVNTPMTNCANRIALRTLQAKHPKTFEAAGFAKKCAVFDKQLAGLLKEYRDIRVCDLAHGLPTAAAISKLFQYIDTSLALIKT